MLARLSDVGDLTAKGEGGADDVGIGQNAAFLILQDRLLGPIPARGGHQGFKDAVFYRLGVVGPGHVWLRVPWSC